MLINCPLKDKSEVMPLVEAGADMFYAGLNPEIIFGAKEGVSNRRPWKFANFSSLENFREAAEIIHKHNKKICLALNEHFYSREQREKIIEFVSSNKSIDSFFIADIGLIVELKKKFPEISITASTCTHIQNKNAVEFYANLGVSEIILPRHLNIPEINGIVKAFPKIKFECFIKNQDCANIDGMCSYSHGVFDSEKICNPCTMLSNFRVLSDSADENAKHNIMERLKAYNEIMFNACGACSIQELAEAGVNAVKIVGRSLPPESKIKDIRFVKKAISMISLPKNEYAENIMSCYGETYGHDCRKRCFYSAQKNEKKNLNIYIHVPFCNYKCSFCAAYSVVGSPEENVNLFLDALEKEIELKEMIFGISKDYTIQNVYIGGGTPNYLSLEQLKRLLGMIKRFNCGNITCELSISDSPSFQEKLELLKKEGVRRISFGMQTISPEILSSLNMPLPKNRKSAVKLALDLGFDVNLDFIIGLPKQDLKEIDSCISFIKETKPTSLSICDLNVWTDCMKKALASKALPYYKAVKEMYLKFKKELARIGYSQLLWDYYSLKKELPFPHPLSKYMAEWETMGFGPFAFSKIGNCFFKNVSGLKEYVHSIKNSRIPCRARRISAEEEMLLNLEALRDKRFIDIEKFNRKFSTDILSKFSEGIDYGIKQDYLQTSDGRLILTEKGLDNYYDLAKMLSAPNCNEFAQYMMNLFSK